MPTETTVIMSEQTVTKIAEATRNKLGSTELMEVNEIPSAINSIMTQADLTNLRFLTPEMFGAVGDGKTDDTIAIQAALNQGGKIYFPTTKTYKITQVILSTDSTELNIDGRLICIGDPAIIINASNIYFTGCGTIKYESTGTCIQILVDKHLSNINVDTNIRGPLLRAPSDDSGSTI